MINQYPNNSIGDLILKHNNSYSFNAAKVINSYTGPIPSVSIIIPYFESQKTINDCLSYLLIAIENARVSYKNLEGEITVVDDGSRKFPAKSSIKEPFRGKINLVVLPENRGITEARNVGLDKSSRELAVYMDSDVVLSRNLLLNHLKLQGYCYENNFGCISFSLFNFIDAKQWSESDGKNEFFRSNNDFRDNCVYQDTWIGCDEDKKFIGEKFTVLETTKNLSEWPKNGKYGPWLLTNMVLGGFFAVDREKAKKVGGCSPFFGKYGFVETSLVTKILANFDDFIIPVPNDFAVHLFNRGASYVKAEKDLLFKKAHNLYFNKYLKFNLERAIDEKI